jgi:hypothetical protein
MRPLSLTTALALALLGYAAAGAGPSMAGSCLKATDAVAGELRKVISRRPTTRQEIWGWHIISPEPLCVEIGDSTVSDLTDIQVVFSKSIKAKDLDESLGMPIGVKGHFQHRADDSFTGDVVIKDAVLVNDLLNDAGMIRRP